MSNHTKLGATAGAGAGIGAGKNILDLLKGVGGGGGGAEGGKGALDFLTKSIGGEGGGAFGSGMFSAPSPVGIANSVLGAITPQQEVNQDFLSRNKNLFSAEMKSEKVQDAVATGLSFVPGVGQVAALAETVGDFVSGFTTDEFGMFKSKGAEVADRLLDPFGTISDLATGDLFGGQKERQTAKDKFQRTKIMETGADANALGAQVKSGIPQARATGFGAPALGRHGMKLTKFSRYGR